MFCIGLANDSSAEVRMALALNIDAPEKSKLSMVQDENKNVRLLLTKCGYMYSSVLKILAQDNNDEVRHLVATNLNTTAEILMVLAKDSDHLVREAVANHPNVTSEIIKTLKSE